MLKAKVNGFVQGVNFRKSVKKYADELGLIGFVENLEDGSVLVVADGNRPDLDKLLAFLYIGPIFAKVGAVDYAFIDKDGNFMSFEIRRKDDFFVDQIRAYLRFIRNIISNAKRRNN